MRVAYARARRKLAVRLIPIPHTVTNHDLRREGPYVLKLACAKIISQGGEKCWEGASRRDSITPPRAQRTQACDPRSSAKEAGAKCACLFCVAIGALQDICGRLAPGTMA